MNGKIKITVLADDFVAARQARGEHGLAFLLETHDSRLLFDTGQGFVIADNARVMGVDLNTVDTVVLSHGHYDHTGGLPWVSGQASKRVTVHAHPDALLPKFHVGPEGAREIGMSKQCLGIINSEKCNLICNKNPVEVAPGVTTTGEIRSRRPEEAIVEAFCRDEQGVEPDELYDDQSLFIDTPDGVVVLLGCAHAGVVGILDYITTLTSGRHVRALIGGMHLGTASDERTAWTTNELRGFNIPFMAPMHCTGQKAAAALWTAFPGACRPCGAGMIFEF